MNEEEALRWVNRESLGIVVVPKLVGFSEGKQKRLEEFLNSWS
jgi:hypothetical protein